MKKDIVIALLYALKEEPLGRRTLVECSGVTESTVRTHLNKMRSHQWVAFAKAGTSITSEGREKFSGLLNAVQAVGPIQLKGLGLLPNQMAIHLRKVNLPQPAWPLRDRAIQAGADGALLLDVKEHIVFADVEDPLEEANPQAGAALRQAFPALSHGDVVLVAFAASRALATRGVWSMVSGLGPLTTALA